MGHLNPHCIGRRPSSLRPSRGNNYQLSPVFKSFKDDDHNDTQRKDLKSPLVISLWKEIPRRIFLSLLYLYINKKWLQQHPSLCSQVSFKYSERKSLNYSAGRGREGWSELWRQYFQEAQTSLRRHILSVQMYKHNGMKVFPLKSHYPGSWNWQCHPIWT